MMRRRQQYDPWREQRAKLNVRILISTIFICDEIMLSKLIDCLLEIWTQKLFACDIIICGDVHRFCLNPKSKDNYIAN